MILAVKMKNKKKGKKMRNCNTGILLLTSRTRLTDKGMSHFLVYSLTVAFCITS